MPSVLRGSAGHVTYVVLTFVPTISRTKLWKNEMFATHEVCTVKKTFDELTFYSRTD